MLNNILIGIPSYFGWDSIRDIRYDAHQKQLEWIKNLGIKTIIYAQDYKKGEYDSNKLIEYEKHKEPKHWAMYKRKFLERFYETNFEWAILADNDAGLYDHHLGYNIFVHMNKFPKLWKDIDFWYPLDPRKEPFTHLWQKYPTIYEQNLIFVQAAPVAKGTMHVVKNPKYSGKPKVLFSDKLMGCDDIEFTMNCVVNGWNVYKCNSSIMKELVDSNKFSTIKEVCDIKKRAKIVIEDKKYLAKKFNLPVIGRNNGGITLKAKVLCKKYMKNSPKTIAISKRENEL